MSKVQAFTPSQLQKPIIIKPQPLSKFFDLLAPISQQHPKLSVVQKGVTHIDPFSKSQSKLSEQIHTLYLGSNLIKRLDNIDQFRNVQTLSLTNNNIEDVRTLLSLRGLRKLENLSLTGNPIVKHPLYKAYAIGTVQTLRILDGTSVRDTAEYSEILSNLQRNFGFLLDNYLKMMKVCHFGRWVEVHRELSPRGSCCSSISFQTFLKLCRLQDNLTQQCLNQFISNLLEDSLQIYLNMQPVEKNTPKVSERMFLAAQEDLLHRQELKLGDLNVKIQRKLFRNTDEIKAWDEEQDHQQYSQYSQGRSCGQLFTDGQAEQQGILDLSELDLQKALSYRRINIKLACMIALEKNAKKARAYRQLLRSLLKIILSAEKRVKRVVFNVLETTEKKPLQTQLTKPNKSQLASSKPNSHRQNRQPDSLSEQDEQRHGQVFSKIRKRQEERKLKKKYLLIWADEFQKRTIAAQTQVLVTEFRTIQQKESRYLKKIELLEEMARLSKIKWEEEKQEMHQKYDTLLAQTKVIYHEFTEAPSTQRYNTLEDTQETAGALNTHSRWKENTSPNGVISQRVLNRKNDFDSIREEYSRKRQQLHMRLKDKCL